MISRLLVVQIADIGDLVLSTPALVALREAHPNAHITLLTTPHSAPLVQGTGLVDAIILFDRRALDGLRSLANPSQMIASFGLARRLRAGRFDVTIFFHHFSTRAGALKFAVIARLAGSPIRIGLENGRGSFLTHRLPDDGFGARHQAQYWLDLAGLVGASSTPRPAQIAVGEPPDSFAAWSAGIRAAGRRILAVHPGSGSYSPARRWDASAFARAADALHAEDDFEIVLVGGAGDNAAEVSRLMTAPALDLSGKTDLPQLAGVLRGCDLFIGADSGVMHIAAACGVPVVAIFGPSNAAAWSPWSPNGALRVVRAGVECSPCSYVRDQVGARWGCPARTCMRLVTPSGVIETARALLSEPLSERPQFVPHQRAADTLSILGMPVSIITYERWLEWIGVWIQGDRAQHVCTINPEMIMIARGDPIFRVILERAALTVPDGVGLLWAARRRGRPLPERVTGSDGVPRIAAAAAERGWRLFFLGAGEGVAQRAAEVLQAQYPSLKIVGVYGGSPAPDEEDSIVERINASGAHLLFVAYGAPEQDKWIARNLPRLRVKMAMGVGGTFDFIAGVVPRAPLTMRQLGLEWLYRLYLQPWRIKRMLRLPRFAWLVVTERVT